MVDVKKMNGEYRPTNPIGQFSKTASRFANDLLELSELQAKLAKSDLEEVLRKSTSSILVAIIGTSLSLASLPVMLFGLASALAWYLEIETWVTQMVIGGGVALLSIVMVALATRGLLRLKNAFQRSAGELKKNMDWVKTVIRNQA